MKKRKKLQILIMFLGVFTALGVCVYSARAEAPDVFPVEHYGGQLSLNEAVKRALSTQAEVKQALARLRKEEALYQGSFSEFLPQIRGEVFEAVATTGDKKLVSYVDAGFEQPIFKGGKILAGRRKHRARYEGEKKQFDQVRLDVELGVRILYVRVLEERELTRLAQGQVKELTVAYERIKKLSEREILPRYQLFSVETLLAKAQHQLVKHKETSDYLLSFLSETIQVGDGEVLEIEALDAFEELADSIIPYLESARQHDPVYKIRDFRIKEKQFEKRELQADRFPHISLSAKWNKIDDVFTDTNRVLVGVMGKWNIWDFGRLGSKIKAKTHEIEEVKWENEIEIREHEKEIRKLFHELRISRQKIKLTEMLVRERKEIFKNEKTRLIAGERGAGELVDSFLALEEAKAERLKAIMEYRILMAKLGRKSAFQGVFEEIEEEYEDLDQFHSYEVDE